MSEAKSLLPCPFCGSANVQIDRCTKASIDVTCWHCRAGIAFGPETPTEGEAVAAWNTRAALSLTHAPGDGQ